MNPFIKLDLHLSILMFERNFAGRSILDILRAAQLTQQTATSGVHSEHTVSQIMTTNDVAAFMSISGPKVCL